MYKKDVEAIIEVSNAETHDQLSNEIVAHLKDVQERIYEINFNQKDFTLRKKELEATLGGLYDWFQRLGFADIEIYFLMKDLDLEKQAFLN